MNLNSLLGTGIFLSMLLIVTIISGPISISAATSHNTNSTQSNLNDIVVKTIQSAKNNTGSALSFMEGGDKCSACIGLALKKLVLADAQLKMVLMMLGNHSKSD